MTSLHRRMGRHLGTARAFFGALCLLAVGGCSSDSDTDWSQMYGMVSKAIEGQDQGVTLQQAAAVPYASIGVRINESAEAILILATTSPQNEQLWTSSAKIGLLIRGGRIVRTAGLEHNLTGVVARAGDYSAPSTQADGTSEWNMDFADLNLYSVPVSCVSKVRGQTAVKNFTVSIPTIRVDETCRSKKVDWSFVNSYWISKTTGLVWHSIQYVSPNSGPIEIEILRPPEPG